MNVHQSLALYDAENPFGSELAVAHSAYMGHAPDDELVRLLDWHPVETRARIVDDALQAMLLQPEYSCPGARSAVNARGYRLGVYPELASAEAVAGLCRDLCAFTQERPAMTSPFASFIAVFEGTSTGSEASFERALWDQLQGMHDLDKRYFPYDERCSADASSPDYAFSFAGSAYFVVGMHPDSSRLARRAPWPALVFNAREQFDRLREREMYGRFAEVVRARENAWQGSVNPNLSAFGEASEARQYSGRAVEEVWTCPFRP